MTADISFLIDIKWTFLDGKDVWWCLSHNIAGIWYESHPNHQVWMYGQHAYSQCSDSQNADFALFKLLKPTNLDIKNAACLHVVQIFQLPTSRPTTSSTQDTMVNALKNNLSQPPAGKYCKLTKKSIWQHHQASKGKLGLEAERVRALGALCSLRSKKKLSAEKRWETCSLSNKEKEKWIEDYVDRETAVARKRVEDAATAIMQEQEHMRNVE